jgi:threonyl-tRNA synthetase
MPTRGPVRLHVRPSHRGADQHHVGEGEAYEEALVVFLAVERADDDKINHAAKEIRHVARRAGVKRIVINPFVHLTSDPAPPAEAHHDAKRLTARLEETFDGEVIFTSFGWYKAFRIDVRGDDASMFFRHV